MQPQVRDRKRARLHDPHMQPLLTYREDLVTRTRKVIPHFDPEDGGARAELLLLLSHVDGDPGSVKNGSEFISVENEDLTASNLRTVVDRIGLPRDTLLVWNVVPWQDGHPGKEAGLGAVHLPRLAQALPQLRGVAVLSREGPVVRAVQEELGAARGLEWVFTSSPAPRSYNRWGAQLTADLRRTAQKLSLI